MIQLLEIDTVNLTLAIVNKIANITAFGEVGRGLAAIFMFFHIASCGISLFQEQKFRIKMLYPFLIFFIVCNFSLISTPTIKVVQSVSTTLCESLGQVKAKELATLGADSSTGKESTSVFEAMMHRQQYETQNLFGKSNVEQLQDIVMSQYTGETPAGEQATLEEEKNWLGRKISNIGGSIVAAIEDAWDNLKMKLVDNFVPNVSNWMKVNAMSIIAVILQFVMDVMTVAMSAFGAMLTGIIVAFGPVTFAFACRQDQLDIILHWFLRLLQYALWAPIICLISAFEVTVYNTMLAGPGGASMLGLIAAFVAAIACLTQVPTIAGMIIEGVHGNASLSQGLSTIASAITSPARLMSTLVMGGEAERDTRQEELLRDIAMNTGGIGTSRASEANPNESTEGLQTNS